MVDRGKRELLLGKQTPVAQHYCPDLLYPIPRQEGRQALAIGAELPFAGCDQWHAYEISWLDEKRRPQVRVGRFIIPADSPFMVESKSFKLYLNSLNSSVFSCEADFAAVLRADIGALVGEPIFLELLQPDSKALDGIHLQGECIDTLIPHSEASSPDQKLLVAAKGQAVDQVLYSHLLRSLCPVTGQPDWATVRLCYSGEQIDQAALLTYLLSFRNHPEFHEQCVERMYCDIQQALQPEELEIQAFYTRRGGLDISPYRSSNVAGKPLARLNRQ